MMYSLKDLFAAGFIVFLFLSACGGSRGDSIPKDKSAEAITNPNGSSELALLMRAMYEEAEQIKQQVEDRDPVQLTLDYESILTAHSTDPEVAESAPYRAMGNAYLETISALRSAPASETKTHYDNMVQNCMNCHQAMCPGPIVRIKKLR